MSSNRVIRASLMGIANCVLGCVFVYAQVGSTGQISGRVSDTTGAVLPGSEVTVTQTETGVVRKSLTNEAGVYTVPNLPVGLYRVEVTLPGFRAFAQAGIVLQVSANLVVDAVLQVGNVAETIEVQANTEAAVETRSMGIGTVIEADRILELPLAARRVTDLVTLGGAAVVVGQSPSWGMATGVNISVAGSERFGVTYVLDGAMNNNRFDQTNMPMPFPGALQEFKVSTSTQEAGTAKATGAAVNAVTKSGTNAFHGGAFWAVRNQVFNARKADAVTRDPLKRNQFGGTIGGPIMQNKLFFFGGYQGTEERRTPADTLSIVPTPAILNGDWTAFNRCFRPNWTDPDFADGSVNPARYSNAAKLLAARLPQPQNECGELRWGRREAPSDKQVVTRIDYQHTTNHSIFGRYMLTAQEMPVPFEEDNLLTSGPGGGYDDIAQSLVVGNTWVISPTTLNSSRFGYNRITVTKQGARFFDPSDVGIAQWTSVPQHFLLTVGVAGGGFTIGQGPTALREMWQNQYQLGTDFSLTRGSHQIGFGAAWARDDVLSLAHTRGVGGMEALATHTGNAIGDFMTGQLTQIRQSMPSTLSPFQHYAGLYAQDTWRAAPRLTLTYGVRWEPYIPMVWKENPLGGIRVYKFSVDAFKAGKKSVVFPTAPSGFTYPSQNADGSGPSDLDGHSAIPSQWDKFAPRVGLAWDPTGAGRTSIRASYGLAYDVIELQSLLNSNNVSPWAADIIHRNGTLDEPWRGLAGGSPFPFDWRATPTYAAGSTFIPFGEDLDMTYVQSWSLSLQQQFARRWLATATYLGSRSVDLWNTTAVNPSLALTPASHPTLFTGPNTCVLEGVTYTPCNQTGNINQRRELRLWASTANPERLPDAALFSNIDEYRSDSMASYHGLLTSVRGDIGSNTTINANYTWGHCISDRTNVGVSNPNQTFHVGRDRADCASDRRHIFNMTAVTGTPQFEGRVLRAVASDWKLSVIYRVSSGNALTITSGTDRALTGLAGQTADQVVAEVYQDKSGKLNSQFINRAAFANPALGSYGNSGFYSVRGFGSWTLDAAVSRVFKVKETHQFEIRAEAFNVPNSLRPNTNTVPTAGLVTSISNPNFGRITSVEEPRIMQLGLKYVF